MANIEKAINDLEEIKSKLIPAISRMYGSGFSSVFACEKVEEKIDNAVELLKEKQPKWIPSSERLPEMFEDVLVYGSFGYEIMHIEDANFNGGVEWCNNHDYFVPVCDTIWIALSELWKFANADKKDGEQE